MKDTIYCPNCGGWLTKNAFSLEDVYVCDCGLRREDGIDIYDEVDIRAAMAQD